MAARWIGHSVSNSDWSKSDLGGCTLQYASLEYRERRGVGERHCNRCLSESGVDVDNRAALWTSVRSSAGRPNAVVRSSTAICRGMHRTFKPLAAEMATSIAQIAVGHEVFRCFTSNSPPVHWLLHAAPRFAGVAQLQHSTVPTSRTLAKAESDQAQDRPVQLASMCTSTKPLAALVR